MYTQRKVERRGCRRKPSFPLITRAGHLVVMDRRRIPDRRLGNIDQELAEAGELDRVPG
jgi:hypothetical protein